MEVFRGKSKSYIRIKEIAKLIFQHQNENAPDLILRFVIRLRGRYSETMTENQQENKIANGCSLPLR